MDIDDAKRELRFIARTAAAGDYDEAMNALRALPATDDPRISVQYEVLGRIIETAATTAGSPDPGRDEYELYVQPAAPGRPLWVLMGWTGALVPKALAARLFEAKGYGLIVCFDRVKRVYAKSGSTDQLKADMHHLAREISTYIETFKPSRTVFVGQSRFTFAACVCARECKGDAVLLPSPLTDIDTELLRIDPGSKARELVARMRDILPPEWRDCKRIITDWIHTGRLHVLYSKLMPRDEKQSERMADLPNTTMHVHPHWAGHDSLPLIMGTDLIDVISTETGGDIPARAMVSTAA